ncbi:MAG: hypothetical protein U0586_00930 [Candidatus Brocadiaceae bacterium]
MRRNIRNSLKRRCPFMRKPGNDCYCVEEIDSIFVEGTIKYCIMNFVECEVYKSLLAKRLLLKLRDNLHGKQCVSYDK